MKPPPITSSPRYTTAAWPRRNRALRFIEAHLEAIVAGGHVRKGTAMPISNPNLALERFDRPPGDPVCVGCAELPLVELRFVADDDFGRIGHDPQNVARATSPEAESTPLPTGEVRDALVTAEHHALRIDDGARSGRAALAVDEVTDASVRDEAELLRFRLVRVGDAEAPARFAHLGLGELAEWKDQPFERRLRQPEEEIALIFVVVAAAQQSKRAVGRSLQARVVPGGDVGRIEAPCDLGEIGELHRAVAAHAGNRCPTSLILGDEGVDDLLSKRVALIEDVVGDSEVLAGAACVVPVFGRTAAADLLLAVGVPQMQRDPDQGRAPIRAAGPRPQRSPLRRSSPPALASRQTWMLDTEQINRGLLHLMESYVTQNT